MDLYWPGLCAGVIVGAYWARVLRLVVKTRRKTGRAANLLPPERVGRILRLIWYPTVVLWVIHLFGSGFVHDPPSPLRRLYSQPLVEWMGVVMAAAALAATMVCWRRMGKSWRMGIDPDEKTQLVVTGPYAYVRHPIYLLSSLLILGTLAAVPTPLMILLAAIHLIFLQWEARREERHLSSVHGAEYDAYVRHVGRFVPRSVWPYSPAARQPLSTS